MSDRLPRGVVLRYALGGVGQSLLPLLVDVWLFVFYTEKDHAFLLTATVLATIRLTERIVGAGLEPVVGYLSDKLRTPFGRRRPFMGLGLPFLCLSFAGLWMPPGTQTLDDPITIVWVAVCLMVFHGSYAIVFGPYNALLPEMHPATKERVRLSTWMGLAEVVGQIAGSIGGGMLAGLGAIVIAGFAFANGFSVMGVVAASIAFVTMLPVVLFTKEPPPQPVDRPLAFREAVAVSLANKYFVYYAAAIFSFRMATGIVVFGVPFVGTKLMGLSEEESGNLLAVIIVVATLAFPIVQRLAQKHGKAKVLTWGGIGFVFLLPLMGLLGLVPIPPLVFGGVVFVLSGFSVATLMVLPRALLADIVDEDAKTTGQRREAIYTGMSGVIEKLGLAFAAGLGGYLLGWFGQTAEQPLGIRLLGVAASTILFAGLMVFRRYDLVPAK